MRELLGKRNEHKHAENALRHSLPHTHLRTPRDFPLGTCPSSRLCVCCVCV
jgi:hypothetical protein